MAIHLLDLPPEILIQILSEIPSTDLLHSTQLTSRYLHHTIRNSLQLQYLIEAKFAAVEDNPNSIFVLAERLDTLRRHEHAWRNFIVGNQKSIAIGNRQLGLYDFSAGIYVLGEEGGGSVEYPTTALKYIALSPHASFSQAGPQWAKISVDHNIMDFGLAVMEHDLIALVTSRPKDMSDTCVTELILLNISTGKYHTSATQPVIYVADTVTDQGHCSVMLEIVGDHLALLLTYDTQVDDMFYLYDWRSGVLKTTLVTTGAYQGFILITENDFLFPNRLQGRLEVFTFSGATFIQKCSLELPQLAARHHIWTLRCRAEPNPTGVRPGVGPLFKNSTTLPYVSSAVDAIALFDIVIIGLHQEEWQQSSFSFMIHRNSLLKCIEARPQSPLLDEQNLSSSPSSTNQIIPPVSIPWRDWGPLNTRWFNTDGTYHGYITITAGQRYVTIPLASQPSPISILDFNKYNVLRYKEPQEVPPPTSNEDIENKSIWGVKKLVNSATLLEPSTMFADELWSALPYVEVKSRELYDYSAVLMDEEHILGIRFFGPRSDEIDILHMQ